MQDYKSLHVVVMISAILLSTHTQTHTDRQLLTSHILLAQPVELRVNWTGLVSQLGLSAMSATTSFVMKTTLIN